MVIGFSSDFLLTIYILVDFLYFSGSHFWVFFWVNFGNLLFFFLSNYIFGCWREIKVMYMILFSTVNHSAYNERRRGESEGWREWEEKCLQEGRQGRWKKLWVHIVWEKMCTGKESLLDIVRLKLIHKQYLRAIWLKLYFKNLCTKDSESNLFNIFKIFKIAFHD